MVYQQENLAAVLYAKHDLRMEPVPIEAPKRGEVQVNIRATGICGSDLHYYHDGGLGSMLMTPDKPMILGHEAAGIVTQIGEDVHNLKVGDRVAIEPGEGCQSCSYCKEGRYNLCGQMKFRGSLRRGPNHGTLRRYACFPAYLCHKMPDNMSYQDGALIEPLAVAVHAVSIRTQVRPGSTVAVIGAGPVGLLTAATAYATGAGSCIIMDIDASRLSFASKYLPGIETLQLPIKPREEDLLDWSMAQASSIIQSTSLANKKEEDQVDIVYECTGVESCISLSVFLARRGGKVMLIGMGNKGCTLMPTDILTTREVDIFGNFRYANSYPKAIELVEKKKIKLDGLVTHQFPLENALEAFKHAQAAPKGTIKVEIGDF
ncbi:hypothetical protein LRAMOSA06856 [Lichtheimia ramosa]|uniref:Enoyl reductase (ER) domain-containing protein n=1 Tax=Lichtheimia ramosa TaxID=688394 RepID=A0A077WA47_9FUNG|nr:hypothetical protein LRAMOSA06856 [Lichtheimia ramosa]